MPSPATAARAFRVFLTKQMWCGKDPFGRNYAVDTAARNFNYGDSDVIGLEELPDTLEYSGEFGSELVLFLPFCIWLSQMGLLKDRRILTYRGMTCFYDDLECLGILEKPDRRDYVPPEQRPRWLPVKNEHDFDGRGRPPQHCYPDLRAKFASVRLPAELVERRRELLIIHNKHNDEWGHGPANHIGLKSLNRLFETLKHRFCIIYIRHGNEATGGFSCDQNQEVSFNDAELVSRHPEVFTLDALYRSHVASGGPANLNILKNALYANCYHFISSQGGGAIQVALFSGSLMVVLHRRGLEEYWGYWPGYYSFMAKIPPIAAICRTEDDLLSALPLFANTAICQGRVLVPPESAPILARLSPATINDRQ